LFWSKLYIKGSTVGAPSALKYAFTPDIETNESYKTIVDGKKQTYTNEKTVLHDALKELFDNPNE
jgi:hypothetical protein